MTARAVLKRPMDIRLTHCPGGGGRTQVTLVYRVSDPYAVQLDIPDHGVVVSWLLSRDLLADGLDGGAGLGDVRVSPVLFDGAGVLVELVNPDGPGSVVLRFARADLERFLDDTDAMVPVGTEASRIDWERELRALAGGEAA
ncbi:SsgA family sporulation/cell division regulator [Amycolatopsis nalaikhensis]|uniref:SsgA family sporulation/cell division regulator n=1 Tax=Amycolatopsis nalaikhensis TaxID=715472 RepID=A0ABY8XWN3_9PSEU|nr:SsgA family sporulation/cell division regulator [Amycolatopsis sp. 2-2]WIV60013.1 SsgA family sporulation/cell division regulator [Amycolatopsis sp. 2-2]